MPHDAMHQYLIHPAAPLVFGTGRPLDFGLGGDTLPFPFPSTLAGAVRAAVAAQSGAAPDPFHGREEVRLGPTALVRLASDLTPQTLLLPRPADAVYVGGRVLPLVPGQVPGACWTDLPDGLAPLTLHGAGDAKPDEANAWWTAAEMAAWLQAPRALDGPDRPVGDRGPRSATRTHVVIEARAAKGAEHGGLFRTKGMDFGPPLAHGGYALWVTTSAGGLAGQPRRVGGEGRLSRIASPPRPLELPALLPLADCAVRVRFVLTTPAVFPRNGWRPDWLPAGANAEGVVPGTDIRIRLAAAAITRAQSYSGWQPRDDGAGRAGPGQPWRVVPAGSVYWLDVVSGDARALHGASLCEGRWRDDGWGYGLVGIGEASR